MYCVLINQQKIPPQLRPTNAAAISGHIRPSLRLLHINGRPVAIRSIIIVVVVVAAQTASRQPCGGNCWQLLLCCCGGGWLCWSVVVWLALAAGRRRLCDGRDSLANATEKRWRCGHSCRCCCSIDRRRIAGVRWSTARWQKCIGPSKQCFGAWAHASKLVAFGAQQPLQLSVLCVWEGVWLSMRVFV